MLYYLLRFCVLIFFTLFSITNIFAQSSQILKIGDSYQGGVIFYLDNSTTPQHGLLVAINDADYRLSPNCYVGTGDGTMPYGACLWATNSNPTNAILKNLFAGEQNTRLLLSINSSPNGFPAAYIAHQYKSALDPETAYWYLPSQSELMQLWSVLNQVNPTIKALGGRVIPGPKELCNAKCIYWSSTESSIDSTMAWHVYLDMGWSYYSRNKLDKSSVRSIRAFTDNDSKRIPI